MSESYLGEIRIFCGTFAPLGWALCDGSQLAISEFEGLFMLIGTTYGGDGTSTFALPDLRGRVPIHRNNQHFMGQQGGVETVTLIADQLPVHRHTFNATTALATQPTPGGNTVAQSGTLQWYTEDTPSQALSGQALAPAGGNRPHENMPPFQAVTYIISLDGIFPPRQ